MSPVQGTCYGYAVHASQPLRYLRGGRGAPLRVRQGTRARDHWPTIREWRRPRAPFDGRLHTLDWTRFALRIEGAGWYEVDVSAPSILVPPGDPLRVEERAWGLPVLLCFLARGDLALHSAALRIGDRALLVGAPGRHGKSTLAAAFASRGGDVLAEDLSCIRLTAGGPEVVPGPAMLRPRSDVADAVSGRGFVEYRRDEDRVHLGLPVPRRGTCDPVPVAGVVLLREDDHVSVGPCPPPRAVRDLWALAFNLPSTEDRTRCFDQLADLVGRVPVWDLGRPLLLEEIPATLDRLGTLVAAGPRVLDDRQPSSATPAPATPSR